MFIFGKNKYKIQQILPGDETDDELIQIPPASTKSTQTSSKASDKAPDKVLMTSNPPPVPIIPESQAILKERQMVVPVNQTVVEITKYNFLRSHIVCKQKEEALELIELYIKDRDDIFDFNQVDEDGASLLALSICNDQTEIAMKLIQTNKINLEQVMKSSNRVYNNKNALFLACQRGNKKIFAELFDKYNKSADTISITSDAGDSMLCWACYKSLNEESLLLLQTNFAKPELISKNDEVNALYWACRRIIVPVIYELLKYTEMDLFCKYKTSPCTPFSMICDLKNETLLKAMFAFHSNKIEKYVNDVRNTITKGQLLTMSKYITFKITNPNVIVNLEETQLNHLVNEKDLTIFRFIV